MPCSSRHSAQRCSFRFHPYMMAAADPPLRPFLLGENEDDPEDEDEYLSSFVENKVRWSEADEYSYSLQMDVPGVMAHHVTIEEKDGEVEAIAIRFDSNGEVSKTYQEVFYIQPKTAVLSDTTAILKDGVLTITVPKNTPQEPMVIETETITPPPTVEAEFRVSLDLPGVKVSDLKVQANEGKVRVAASRTVGDRTMHVRRIFEAQPSTADMEQARVFLQDGVLTFVAPIVAAKEEAPGLSDDGGTSMRTIHVTEEHDGDNSGVPTFFASLNLQDNEGRADNAGEIVVETVVEESDKDWEQVTEDAKKKHVAHTD